jgi:hypothetical protein
MGQMNAVHAVRLYILKNHVSGNNLLHIVNEYKWIQISYFYLVPFVGNGQQFKLKSSKWNQ